MDEGATIGEQGEGEGAAAEAEQERVGANVRYIRVGGERGLQGGEVDGTVVLVDLDGIAAAQGDVRAMGASEVRETAEITDLAAGALSGGGDLGVVEAGCRGGCPQVEGDEGAAKQMELAGEDFEGFSDLEGSGEVDGGGKDAGSVAGLDRTDRGHGKDAGEAGGGGICVAALRGEE